MKKTIISILMKKEGALPFSFRYSRTYESEKTKKRAKWAILSMPIKLGMVEKLDDGKSSATIIIQADARVNLYAAIFFI